LDFPLHRTSDGKAVPTAILIGAILERKSLRFALLIPSNAYWDRLRTK
jgi:hypothetical protein